MALWDSIRTAQDAQVAAERDLAEKQVADRAVEAANRQADDVAGERIRAAGSDAVQFLRQEGVVPRAPRSWKWQEWQSGPGPLRSLSKTEVSVRLPTGWTLKGKDGDAWVLTEAGELLCIWRRQAGRAVSHELRPIAPSRRLVPGRTLEHLTVGGWVTDTGVYWNDVGERVWWVPPIRSGARAPYQPPHVAFDEALAECLVALTKPGR